MKKSSTILIEKKLIKVCFLFKYWNSKELTGANTSGGVCGLMR